MLSKQFNLNRFRLDESIQEKMTPGLKRAYAKMEGKYRCKECGVVIPKYEGRYPKKCAECGGMEFEALQQEGLDEGADLYCPNCGDRLGKQIEVEDDYGPARPGQMLKIYCSQCGQSFKHRAEYDTR